MTSGGYSIGFKELYDLVTDVGRKLDALHSSHSQQISANTERLETHGKALQKMWDRLDNQKNTNWQTNIAIATSAVSLLTALATLVIK